MTRFPKMLVLAAASLLPWQAFAADAPASAAKSPLQDGHSDYWDYWAKIDTNHDGVIDKKEWMAHAEEQFKEMDANGDGVITRDEIEKHREMMRAHFQEMRDQHKNTAHESSPPPGSDKQ